MADVSMKGVCDFLAVGRLRVRKGLAWPQDVGAECASEGVLVQAFPILSALPVISSAALYGGTLAETGATPCTSFEGDPGADDFVLEDAAGRWLVMSEGYQFARYVTRLTGPAVIGLTGAQVVAAAAREGRWPPKAEAPDATFLHPVPAGIVDAAQQVGQWFEARGIRGWKLGPVQERQDALPAPSDAWARAARALIAAVRADCDVSSASREVYEPLLAAIDAAAKGGEGS